MKQLFLIRHAKSSWKDAALADVDRPLNKRGERDAPVMGRRIAGKHPVPDLIVTSPAQRARATATVIARELGYVGQPVVNEAIYGAGVWELLEFIRTLEDDSDRVLLVGHNPAVTDLVNALSGGGIENIPTCGVAELSFDATSWREVGQGKATLVEFDYPKRTRE